MTSPFSIGQRSAQPHRGYWNKIPRLSRGRGLRSARFESVAPELKSIPPGPDWLRVAAERVFVDTVPAQHKGLQQVLGNFAADVIIGDDMLFGVLPILLGPRSKRPSIVLCGTSFLHWRREDGAPHFIGLPPATTKEQRDDYAAIYREHDRLIYQPVADRLNRSLQTMGVGPLSMTLFDSVVELADAYLQVTVPSFEFPRDIPPSVHFVGTPRRARPEDNQTDREIFVQNAHSRETRNHKRSR
jgi:hypothetical protein